MLSFRPQSKGWSRSLIVWAIKLRCLRISFKNMMLNSKILKTMQSTKSNSSPSWKTGTRISSTRSENKNRKLRKFLSRRQRWKEKSMNCRASTPMRWGGRGIHLPSLESTLHRHLSSLCLRMLTGHLNRIPSQRGHGTRAVQHLSTPMTGSHTYLCSNWVTWSKRSHRMKSPKHLRETRAS